MLLLQLFLASSTFLMVVVVVVVEGKKDDKVFVCDWTAPRETCPWPMDEECDHKVADECDNADCYDCDPLREEFRYDCPGCVEAGGYWCPGDAMCLSYPATASDYFHKYYSQSGVPMQTSCPTLTDWKQSCSSGSTPITNINTGVTTTTNPNNNVYNDPLYGAMAWEYRLINVERVWRELGITGRGVRVRINDDGVDDLHPEFLGRFDYDNSCPNWRLAVEQEHGTACASLIGAAANNNECAVGIAPGVTISACSNEFVELDSDREGAILTYKLDGFDISSNSWGPFPCDTTAWGEGGDDDDDDDDVWDWDEWLDDDDGGLLYDDDATISTTTTKRRRPRKPTRRPRRQRRLQCPFTYHHPLEYDTSTTNHQQIHPCTICGSSGTMDLTDPKCQRSIIEHCFYYADLDQAACLEYLDLFVDCQYHHLSLPLQNAFHRAITEGRNGKGIIFTFPAGNENEWGSNGNLDGFINSRLTISVGAVDKYGKRAAYSTPGATTFVTAPAGDEEFLSNQITARVGGGCVDSGIGSSYSAPTVAGVVALMLEANPNLTWRDVQGVLASTSQYNDQAESSWIINGAGVRHNYHYGFGLVDAYAAVQASKTWISWGPEQQYTASSGLINRSILDHDATSRNSEQQHQATTATSSIVTLSNPVNNEEVAVTESVVVYVDLRHASRGDLTIKLISPSGTESILAPGKRPENTQLHLEQEEHWKLMTVRNWGESPFGEWKLEIVDEKAGTLSDCIDLPFQYVGSGGDVVVDDDDDGAYEFLNGAESIHNGEPFQRRGGPGRRLIHRHHQDQDRRQLALDLEWDCEAFELDGICANGAVLDDIANQVKVEAINGFEISGANSCCVCGGGSPAAYFPSILKSWRIVVYAHQYQKQQSTSSSTAPVDKSANANDSKTTTTTTARDAGHVAAATAVIGEGVDFSPISGSTSFLLEWGVAFNGFMFLLAMTAAVVVV